MSAADYAVEPGGKLRDDRADRGGRILARVGGLDRRADEPRAHDHAVGAGVRGGARVLGRGDAEAERDGDVGVRADAADEALEPGGHPGALAGDAGHRDRVDEAARAGADRREPLVGARRRHERHERQAGARRTRRGSRRASSIGTSGTIRPEMPLLGDLGGEALEPAGQDRVARNT